MSDPVMQGVVVGLVILAIMGCVVLFRSWEDDDDDWPDHGVDA